MENKYEQVLNFFNECNVPLNYQQIQGIYNIVDLHESAKADTEFINSSIEKAKELTDTKAQAYSVSTVADCLKSIGDLITAITYIIRASDELVDAIKKSRTIKSIINYIKKLCLAITRKSSSKEEKVAAIKALKKSTQKLSNAKNKITDESIKENIDDCIEYMNKKSIVLSK